MLFDEKRKRDAKLDRNLTRTIGAGVYRWGERALHRLYPALGRAARTHPGILKERCVTGHRTLIDRLHTLQTLPSILGRPPSPLAN